MFYEQNRFHAKINELIPSVFAANKAKGFHDQPRPLHTARLLIVSEIIEAFEAIRKDNYAKAPLEYDGGYTMDPLHAEKYKAKYEEEVKDTFQAELAGTCIRCMDTLGSIGDTFDPPSKDHFTFKEDQRSLFYATDAAMQGGYSECLWFIFDIADAIDIDLLGYIKSELLYNQTRPFKHGKKF